MSSKRRNCDRSIVLSGVAGRRTVDVPAARRATVRMEAAAVVSPVVERKDKTVHVVGPQRSQAYVQLFRAVLATGAQVRSVNAAAQSQDVIKGPMRFAFELLGEDKVQACADSLAKVYADLQPVTLIDVQRSLTGPDSETVVMDLDNYAVFVDNSASPSWTTITVCVRDEKSPASKVLEVLEQQNLIVRFVNVTVGNGVQHHIIHVLNGHGDQLDESHRRRVQGILYRALVA